jgi:hypothetical protein
MCGHCGFREEPKRQRSSAAGIVTFGLIGITDSGRYTTRVRLRPAVLAPVLETSPWQAGFLVLAHRARTRAARHVSRDLPIRSKGNSLYCANAPARRAWARLLARQGVFLRAKKSTPLALAAPVRCWVDSFVARCSGARDSCQACWREFSSETCQIPCRWKGAVRALQARGGPRPCGVPTLRLPPPRVRAYYQREGTMQSKDRDQRAQRPKLTDQQLYLPSDHYPQSWGFGMFGSAYCRSWSSKPDNAVPRFKDKDGR